MPSLLITVILLIVTPAWFGFAFISMWKHQWKQALVELTTGLVFTAILVMAASTIRGLP